jgi:hypothetical protein
MEGFPFAIKFFHVPFMACAGFFKLSECAPMRGKKAVAQVILILFLISVGVLEVILRHDDRGKQQASARDREPGKSSTSSPDSNGSLQSLARAVQHETPPPMIEAPTRKEESAREYNREDARSK